MNAIEMFDMFLSDTILATFVLIVICVVAAITVDHLAQRTDDSIYAPYCASFDGAIEKCTAEYYASISLGYSPRHARANLRAILHAKYKFSPEQRREVMRLSIYQAINNRKIYEETLRSSITQ